METKTEKKLILDYPYVAKEVENEVSKNALDFFCKKFEKCLEEKGTIYSYSLLHWSGDDFYIHATLYIDKDTTEGRYDNVHSFKFEKIHFIIAQVMSFTNKQVLFDGQTMPISYIEELYKQSKISPEQ